MYCKMKFESGRLTTAQHILEKMREAFGVPEEIEQVFSIWLTSKHLREWTLLITHTHKGFLLSLNTVLTRVSGTADLISALFSFFREVFSPPIPPSPPPRTHTQEVLAQFQHGFDSCVV